MINLLFNLRYKFKNIKHKFSLLNVTVLLVLMLFTPHLLAQETTGKRLLTHEIFQETFLGDYEEMINRRLIRVLVVTNKTNYFIDKATKKGITYEFFSEFEKQLNTDLGKKHIKVALVYIPVSRSQLMPLLLEGHGDIAAASLTITKERLALVNFTDPLASDISEIIVTPASSPAIEAIDDLPGKTVFVRKSSSYFQSLVHLNATFSAAGMQPVKIELADENFEDEDLLEMVNAELLPMIVVDDYLAQFWATIYENIKLNSELKVSQGAELAFMIRKNNPQLIKVLNSFIKDHKIGTLFGNIMKKKYFQNSDYVLRANNTEDSMRLKATAILFKKYSKLYEFDWLLIAALSYQESRIDQDVVSTAGAVGVMQVLPSTAKGDPVNISDITDIENNIHAGVKYLRWIHDTYYKEDRQIDEINKLLFTLASYNAGAGKVGQLRKETTAMGLNPNIWFSNVELAAAKIIGRETVHYVSNIFKYYYAYSLVYEKTMDDG